MSDAATPANPTGQIATNPATYDWRKDAQTVKGVLNHVHRPNSVGDCDTCASIDRLIAHVEQQQAALSAANERVDALRSLVEETEAVKNEYRAMCEWLAGFAEGIYAETADTRVVSGSMTWQNILAAAREAVRP